MNTRAHLLKSGPVAFLRQMAQAFSQESEVDLRAQVVLHTRSGKTWTGVPTEFIEEHSRQFLVLETHPKKNIIVLDIGEIQALEIENLESVQSFLEKPWLNDNRFRQVSRLQLQRETEALWKSFPHQKLLIEMDQFPISDETPGALLAWVNTLKMEIDLLMNTVLGKEALHLIDQIVISHGPDALKCERQNSRLKFNLDLTKKSFDRTLIAKYLNDHL